MSDASGLFLLITVCLAPFIGAAFLLHLAKPSKEDLEQKAYMEGLYGPDPKD
jgi:hypothetical protein